jgi:hypothetical protein
MVRTTNVYEQPLELIVNFARHYTHGPSEQYDHLFFFSKDKGECESLCVFGGRVYKQRNGYAWYMGNRKNLVALFKLLEARDDLSNDMKSFMNRMRKKGIE